MGPYRKRGGDMATLRLREKRKMLELSQAELAQRAGIPLRTYQRYERDEREPNATALKALADALETTTDDLFIRQDTTKTA